MTNNQFAQTNRDFLTACDRVKDINGYGGFKPSRRQASKWRRKKGIAWKLRDRTDRQGGKT